MNETSIEKISNMWYYYFGVLFMYDEAVAINAEFKVSKKVLNKVEMNEAAFVQYAKRMVALDMYKNRDISLGYCAEVAEMTKEAFVLFLGQNKVSVFNFKDAEEFLEEAHNA